VLVGAGGSPHAFADAAERLGAVRHDDADEQQDAGDDRLLVGRDVDLGEPNSTIATTVSSPPLPSV
jgi:hypothetical protein